MRKRGRVCCTSTSSLSIPHALRSLACTYSRYPGEWEGGDDDVASEVRAIATAVSAQGHHPGVVCTGYVLRHRGLFCPCKLCCQSKYLPLQQQAGTQGPLSLAQHTRPHLCTLLSSLLFSSRLSSRVVLLRLLVPARIAPTAYPPHDYRARCTPLLPAYSHTPTTSNARPEDIQHRRQQGFQMLCVGMDLGLVMYVAPSKPVPCLAILCP